MRRSRSRGRSHDTPQLVSQIVCDSVLKRPLARASARSAQLHTASWRLKGRDDARCTCLQDLGIHAERSQDT